MDTGAQDAALGALTEQLAAIEHERWASWQDYLHRICEPREDGALIIPTGFVDRWERQIATPYADLSEREQESDREQVRRYLPLIQEALDAAQAREAALAQVYGEIAGYVAHHDDRWGARADQMSVPVDYGDLCDWWGALALAGSPAPDGVTGEEERNV